MAQRCAAVALLGDIEPTDTANGAVVAGGDALSATGAPIGDEIDTAVGKDDKRMMRTHRHAGPLSAVNTDLQLRHARPGAHAEAPLLQDNWVLRYQVDQIEAGRDAGDFAEPTRDAACRIEGGEASWFHRHKLLPVDPAGTPTANVLA